MNFHKNHLQPWGIELVNKYPLIFTEPDPYNASWAHKAGIAEADYCNLRYGFECQSGWKEQIENIARTATEIVKHLRGIGLKDEEAYIHSCIVKEKFGTLAWQGQHKLPPLFQELWYSYYGHQEGQSGFTCEVTGKHGTRRFTKNGQPAWNRTLCTEEAISQGYDLTDWEKEKIARIEKQKPETD
jgi:hypothetical protein